MDTIFTKYDFNYILGSKAQCFECGCTVCEADGEALVKGASVIRVSFPTAKKFVHKTCLKKIWKNGSAKTHTSQTNWNSQLDNHKVEIIAPKEELNYLWCGFDMMPYSPTHRKNVLWNEENGERSGAHIKKALEKAGYKVFVNGVEVSTHAEYRKLLGK